MTLLVSDDDAAPQDTESCDGTSILPMHFEVHADDNAVPEDIELSESSDSTSDDAVPQDTK